MKKLFLLILLFVSFAGFSQGQFVKVESTATSGTVTLPDTQQSIIFVHNTASITLGLTIAFPANPVDGQIIIICSASGITTLSLTAVVGTITNTLGTMSGASPASWIYSSASSKWFKIR